MPPPRLAALLASLPRFIVEASSALLAPARCAACDANVPLSTIFCPPCAITVEPFHGVDPRAHAAFAYGGAVALALTRFKYQKRPDLAAPLAALLQRRVFAALRAERPSIVAPVPLHPARLAERGYNQAALLARPLARALGARFAPRALARFRDTPRQTGLDRHARVSNVERAFRVRQIEERARVLLVDDVLTTGATLAACADALRNAGCGEIAAVVVARAELGDRGAR